MRVLFIFPDLASDVVGYTGVLSPAVSLLGGMLASAGHDVRLYHMVREPSQGEFRSRVRAAQPDLVAFSFNSHYARRIPAWSGWAREEAKAPVVVGGVHPTLAAREVAAIESIDYTCVGEGEAALLDLVERLEEGRDTTTIENFHVRTRRGVVQNPPRPLLRNLDELPDPDYGLFDFSNLYNVRKGIFPFLMSRGCGFRCTYCSIPALRELSGERSGFWRFLSPERAVGQIHALLDAHMPQAQEVHFLDAIFFSSRKWLRDFAPLYRERIGLDFSCNLRADYVNAETARLLKGMGCSTVRFGVESGNDFLSREILQRGMTAETLRRAFALLREYGIRRVAYNLVGLPEETLEMSLETVRLNADLAPDLAIPFIFYPYPGTALHARCRERGYLTGRELDNYFQGVVTDIPTFRAPDILFVHRFFRKLVRLYATGRGWPRPVRSAWLATIHGVLTSRFFPRGPIVYAWERYKTVRHGLGERLVRRAPRLYRALGGTAPV